jgi:hypothetical protein
VLRVAPDESGFTTATALLWEHGSAAQGCQRAVGSEHPVVDGGERQGATNGRQVQNGRPIRRLREQPAAVPLAHEVLPPRPLRAACAGATGAGCCTLRLTSPRPFAWIRGDPPARATDGPPIPAPAPRASRSVRHGSLDPGKSRFFPEKSSSSRKDRTLPRSRGPFPEAPRSSRNRQDLPRSRAIFPEAPKSPRSRPYFAANAGISARNPVIHRGIAPFLVHSHHPR